MNEISFNSVSEPLFQAKFWRQVKRNGLCWEWQGAKSRLGYGIVCVDGISVRAHRVSYVMAFGSIATDKIACHTCDNPSCINPLHIYEGTDMDNVTDCIIKGRRGKGGLSRKLTADQVSEIRQEYAEKKASAMVLARRHHVGLSIIRKLVSGQTYKDAPGPLTIPGKHGRPRNEVAK